MRRAIIALAVLAVLAVLALGGCRGSGEEQGRAPGEVGTVTVEALAMAMEADTCTVLDANSTQTRILLGVIPGARLLSHYKDYDLGELPPARDRKLVFYCANEACGASHEAAGKALAAGYTDVAVLPAGVAGWRRAGKAIAPLGRAGGS